MTTNYQFYGRPERELPSEIIQKAQQKENRISGANEKPIEQQGMQMTSVLTGEKYRNCTKKAFF